MATFRTFEEIDAWQQARILRKQLNEVTRRRPFSRDFVLRDQTCRAGTSAMANIVEGFERQSDREFVRFLRIAKSSAAEVRSHLYVALDEGYITAEAFQALMKRARRVGGLIGSLIAYLIQQETDAGRGTKDGGPDESESSSQHN